MTSKDGVQPHGGGDKFDSFDDRAIRIELRRMVENEERRCLEVLAATENEIRAECETATDVGEDVKRKLYAKMETAKSDARRGYQMMLDFIDRQ